MRQKAPSRPAASRAALLSAALALAAACGGRPGAGAAQPSGLVRGEDAPYDLAENQDLALLEDELAALPESDPGRAPLRARIAAERARRLALALEDRELTAAGEELASLLRLWSPAELADPARAGADLAPHRPALDRARALFARAGQEREAAAALLALALVDQAAGRAGTAANHRAEIEEIFAYADEVSMASHGEAAQRARPIEILEYLVDIAPVPWAVDRLVALYVERQRALDAYFRRGNADLPAVIRAHGDGVIRTTWNIVRVLARSGRIAEAPAAIEPVVGIGDDGELRHRLRRALDPQAGAADWVLLAARFRSPDPDEGDPRAALAITLEATRRFPTSATAALAAAEVARQLGSERLAIRLLRAGLAREPNNADAASQLAELYLSRIGELTRTDRPRAAARVLHQFEELERATRAATGEPMFPDRADALAAMGRGLVSLGELAAARRHLERSLALRPTLDALESLGTIASKQGRQERAIELFRRALAMKAEEPGQRYQQCRILRLLAEAHLAAGDKEEAVAQFRAAMAAWHQLAQEIRLPAPYLAEALVEQGKILWRLGERETALVAFDSAVDADPDGASTHASVVAFLIVRSEYERALDAYHRALGSREIDDYFKVYMSLWVLAEARRQGRPVDPIAHEFLAGRDGPLWYDDLARFAGGRLGLKALERRATTRGRRAELLYYSAVLGGDLRRNPARARRLLEGVVETGMVLFFEYEMAQHWLAHGFGTDGK